MKNGWTAGLPSRSDDLTRVSDRFTRGGYHPWLISISIVPHVTLVPRVVEAPDVDADELNHDPCAADAGTSSTEYPLGVVSEVAADRPARNTSPSLELPGESEPPRAVLPVPVLSAEPAMGALAL